MTQEEVKDMLSSQWLHGIKSAAISALCYNGSCGSPFSLLWIILGSIWAIASICDFAVYINYKREYGTNNQGIGENNQGPKGTDQEQG